MLVFPPIFLWMFPETPLATKINLYLDSKSVAINELNQNILEYIENTRPNLVELSLDEEVLNNIGKKMAKINNSEILLERLLPELLALLNFEVDDETERITLEKERYFLLYMIKNILEHIE